MDLAYSQEQTMFADMVERMLADRYGFERRMRIVASPAGSDPDIWAALAELGCFALPISEADGGIGGSMIDIAILMEALGRHLVTEPVLASAVLAGRMAARAGAGALVEAMIAGGRRLAFADGRRALAAHDGAVTGMVPLVAGGAGADTLLVAVPDGAEVALLAVPADAPGLSIVPVRLLDGGRAADVTFADVKGERLSAAAAAIVTRGVAEATVAACWEAVGSMNAARAQTAAYLRERHQFGRALADFQAVQHRVAEMTVACEEARAAALLAALALDGAPLHHDVTRAVSGAKVRVGRCARIVAQGAVQLHGGMGVSEELPIAAHFRTLLAFEAAWGTTTEHLARYADAVLSAGSHRTSAVLAEAA
ncbi:acyl-CoA dehydrogenase family protein [Sphingomonas profundi]|uniref:acyl-CoA dehydrogenase family protein n=1 Tax=Alterirhizorhabdus profundi TaxID=2681549 RepID=UPI0018D1DC09|nr:acyl-CoA dehydrogenase family protein [Sphingomonas profundi]